MKAVSWQMVVLFISGLAAFITLYLLVPVDDPMRGALVAAFNALIGAIVVLGVNRRQQAVEDKVDQVIANGHGESQGDTPVGDHRVSGG